MENSSVEKVAKSLAALFIESYCESKSKVFLYKETIQLPLTSLYIKLYSLPPKQRKIFLDNFDAITKITENILKSELNIREFKLWHLLDMVVKVDFEC